MIWNFALSMKIHTWKNEMQVTFSKAGWGTRGNTEWCQPECFHPASGILTSVSLWTHTQFLHSTSFLNMWPSSASYGVLAKETLLSSGEPPRAWRWFTYSPSEEFELKFTKPFIGDLYHSWKSWWVHHLVTILVFTLASQDKKWLAKEKTTVGSRHEMFHSPQAMDWSRMASSSHLDSASWYLLQILYDLWCLALNSTLENPTFLWGKLFCSWPSEAHNVQEGLMWDKLYGNNLALLINNFKKFYISDLISGILNY